MAKKIIKETGELKSKQPRTVKLSTVITAIAFIVVTGLSFWAGTFYNHNFNALVDQRAIEKAQALQLKEDE